jgi:hypothetical protein
VYAQKANRSIDPRLIGSCGRPKGLQKKYAELGNTRVAEDGRGWMSWGEAARRDGSPPIKILGINVNDIFKNLKPIGVIAAALSTTTMLQIPQFTKDKSQLYNDGFILSYSPAALAAAYFVEPSKAFASMDFLRKVQMESKSSKDFAWSLPGEFRFVNVRDSAVLQPTPAGLWFNCQMISFAEFARDAQAWKRDFKRVEEHWVKELGAKPHMGKLFGFEQRADGSVEPFADSYTCTIYSDKQKETFDAYRRRQDPDGLFATGLGMKFLQPCSR